MTNFIYLGALRALRGSILIGTPNLSRFADTLDRLNATIEARKDADPSSSYTAKLLSEGVERLAKKFGEEAVETVIAAISGDKHALAAESADVIYHWLALLAGSGVSLDEVAAKLEAREGRSGLDEKAARPGS
jgi:phosphoribosyl-ATP pyrophosphohydrolase